MFFYIRNSELFPQGPGLHGIISSDGELYFSATDVFKFLNIEKSLKALKSFAKLWSAQVSDVMHQKFQHQMPARIWNMKLFRFQKTLHFLKEYGEANNLSRVVIFADQLNSESTQVKITNDKLQLPTIYELVSINVEIVPKSGEYLKDFYTQFKHQCQYLYRMPAKKRFLDRGGKNRKL